MTSNVNYFKKQSNPSNLIKLLTLISMLSLLFIVSGCGSDDEPTNSTTQPSTYTSGTLSFSYTPFLGSAVAVSFSGNSLTSPPSLTDLLTDFDIVGGSHNPGGDVSVAYVYGGKIKAGNIFLPGDETVDLVFVTVSDNSAAISTKSYDTKPVPLCAFLIMEDVPLDSVVSVLLDPDVNAESIQSWAETLSQYTAFNLLGGNITCSGISDAIFTGTFGGTLLGDANFVNGIPTGSLVAVSSNGTFNLNK